MTMRRRCTRALALGALASGLLVSSGCMMFHHADAPAPTHSEAPAGPTGAPTVSSQATDSGTQRAEQTHEKGHGMMGGHGTWGWIGMGAMMVGMMVLIIL